MKVKISGLAALIGLTLLAGCGDGGQSALGQIGGMMLGRLTGGAPHAGAAAAPDPANLAKSGQPLMLAAVPALKSQAALVISGRNGPWTTWRAADGASLILRDGVLSGTRGLGPDLLAADVADTVKAVRAGKGQATRVQHYLDGENHEFVRRYDCTYSGAGHETITVAGTAHATRKVVEDCTSADAGSFENLYWIGTRDGVIWQSRQWIGRALGPVVMQRLVR